MGILVHWNGCQYIHAIYWQLAKRIGILLSGLAKRRRQRDLAERLPTTHYINVNSMIYQSNRQIRIVT